MKKQKEVPTPEEEQTKTPSAEPPHEVVVAEEVGDDKLPIFPNEVLELANVSAFDKIKAKAIRIIKEYGFSEIIRKITDYEKELDGIIIEDEFDFDNMDRCGTIRKALVKLRTGSGTTHAAIKEDAKLEGRFIDGLKNKVEEIGEPVEKKAKDKEETAERAAALRRKNRIEAREAELSTFGYNFAGLDLGNMPDDIYAQTVEDAKLLQEAKEKIRKDREDKEREAFAEEQRLKAEKELQSVRLTELNGLGIIYSNSDLGSLSPEVYESTKANLIQQKNEQIAENERQKKLNEARLAQAEKDKKEQDAQLEALRHKNEEAEKKIKEQQQTIKEKDKTIRTTTFAGGNVTLAKTAKRKPSLEESKYIRVIVSQIETVIDQKHKITDPRLTRVFSLFTDMIRQGNTKLLEAMNIYEKGED